MVAAIRRIGRSVLFAIRGRGGGGAAVKRRIDSVLRVQLLSIRHFAARAEQRAAA
jgi:hypothetical protein